MGEEKEKEKMQIWVGMEIRIEGMDIGGMGVGKYDQKTLYEFLNN